MTLTVISRCVLNNVLFRNRIVDYKFICCGHKFMPGYAFAGGGGGGTWYVVCQCYGNLQVQTLTTWTVYFLRFGWQKGPKPQPYPAPGHAPKPKGKTFRLWHSLTDSVSESVSLSHRVPLARNNTLLIYSRITNFSYQYPKLYSWLICIYLNCLPII